MLIVKADRFTNKQPQNYNVKQTEASMTAHSHSSESSSQRGVCTGVMDKRHAVVHTDACRRTKKNEKVDSDRMRRESWKSGNGEKDDIVKEAKRGVQSDYGIVMEQGTQTRGRLEK